MIEYIAFAAAGLFAVGIMVAIVIGEFHTRQDKLAEARREAGRRQQERRIAARQARLARSTPVPVPVAED
jgi:hypothetical protein